MDYNEFSNIVEYHCKEYNNEFLFRYIEDLKNNPESEKELDRLLNELVKIENKMETEFKFKKRLEQLI